MNVTSSQKTALVFVGAFLTAGIVLSTMIFPFWHLIREDVYEQVTILANNAGTCYVETADNIPKTVENCSSFKSGDTVTIKFGQGLAWATIVDP